MLRNFKNTFKSIGMKLDGPVFVKEYEGSKELIDKLELLKTKIGDGKIVESIDNDIMLIKYGDAGEKNVSYELENSFLPMFILHDVTIMHEDYKAQLDFVIITSKYICVLETKKLSGDISINADGDFIRHFKNQRGKVYKKEGMYSPISQNERHIRILKDLLIKEKLINRMPVLSLVVIANPKSIIDYKYAKKEIKDQIVKYDQLTKRLKSMALIDVEMPIVSMQEIAEFLVKNDATKPENTFLAKYQKHVEELVVDEKPQEIEPILETISSVHLQENIVTTELIDITDPVIGDNQMDENSLREALKCYRLEKSREEGVKAYFIFNNKQMEDIIEKMPQTKEALISCDGFGEKKAEKYGDMIISIVKSAL